MCAGRVEDFRNLARVQDDVYKIETKAQDSNKYPKANRWRNGPWRLLAIQLLTSWATYSLAQPRVARPSRGREKAWRTALEPLVPQECVGHVIMNRNIITLRNMPLSYAGVFVVNCASADFLSIKVECILKTVSIPSEARYKNGM